MILDGNVELLEAMLKKLPANIFYKDTECRYQFATHYWHHLLQEGNDWTIQGKTDLEVQKDKSLGRIYYEDDKKILRTGEGSSYISEVKLDGVTEYLEIIKEAVTDKNGDIIGIVGLINDVTDRILLEKRLEKNAETDALTGFYNRRYLQAWIEEDLKNVTYPVSIISGDCDDLKKTNDTYGHAVGDELIRVAASLFRVVLPQTSIMCRLGGDEFLFILPDTSYQEAEFLIERLIKTAEKVYLKGNSLSVSYGLSTMESGKEDFKMCMEEADQQMYINKCKQKAHYRG